METDDAGCPVWAWDVRKPAPGETSICFPDRDAHVDAPHDGAATD
jgi:hypothetical protein